MKKIRTIFYAFWAVIVVLLTPVFLSAPIAWWMGPPDMSKFEDVEGTIEISKLGRDNYFKPSRYELMQSNGQIKIVHCGFIVAKQKCGFASPELLGSRTSLKGKYHWYWGFFEYKAISLDGRTYSTNRENVLKWTFDNRKFHGLEFWFLIGGVMALGAVVAVFVLLPLWLIDKSNGEVNG